MSPKMGLEGFFSGEDTEAEVALDGAGGRGPFLDEGVKYLSSRSATTILWSHGEFLWRRGTSHGIIAISLRIRFIVAEISK